MRALRPIRARFAGATGHLLGALFVAIVVLAGCSDDTPTESPESTEAQAGDAAEPPAVTALSDDPTTTEVAPPPPPPRSIGQVTAEDTTPEPDAQEDADAQTDERALAELQVGDCVDLPVAESSSGERSEEDGPTDDEVVFAPLVPCDEPHDAEVYARVSLNDDPEAGYPGDDEVLAGADRVCLEAFEGYVGAPYVDTQLEIVHLRPNEAAWVRGDRVVVCAVVSIDLEPMVGSVGSDT